MAQQQSVGEEEEYEWVDEVKMVPQEVMVEEVTEKVDEVFVTEQREMPTVIARYPFQGQGMSMVKNEVRQCLVFCLSFVNLTMAVDALASSL